MTEAPKRVAIIGGGITGSCAANHLQSLLNESTNVEIVLFDQGGRGPGGRASHRRVRRCGKIRLSPVGKKTQTRQKLCGSKKSLKAFTNSDFISCLNK